MKSISLFIISSFLLVSTVFSQSILPNNLSKSERARLHEYVVPQTRAGFTTAPDNEQLRTAAEWEEMRGTVIAWRGFYTFLGEIVKYAQEEGFVYIFCDDSNAVKSSLQLNNIPLIQVKYLEENTNSVWIRDYGPNNVYMDEVGELVFVDWVYNRNRPSDDLSPEKLAEYLDIDIYKTSAAPIDLVNTGGNFMTDGLANAFASMLVMEENESTSNFNSTVKSVEEVDQIMEDFMGIQSYIKMPVLPHDDIHHIDMHMKLLDEETLLIGEYPDGVSDGPQIEENLQYILDNFNSAFGTPYKVVRIEMPIGDNWSGQAWPSNGGTYKTYTNSLIINQKVLVPIYNADTDAAALEVYKNAMPGYEIIGIDANDPIQSSGAIHCTSHEIAASDPLWIVHQALNGQDAETASYSISASIKHNEGIASAKVYYKVDENLNFNTVDMTIGTDDIWTASLPQQIPSSEIHYYIEAIANSGKIQKRPLPAPEANWTFRILNNTGIENLTEDIKLKYYNKNEQLHVYYTTQNISDVQLELFDINGKSIQNIYTGASVHGVNQHQMNTAQLSKGFYFIRARINQAYINKKIIIE